MKEHESIPEQAHQEVKKSLSAGTMVVGTAIKTGLGRRLLIRMARKRSRFISSLASELLGPEEIHPK